LAELSELDVRANDELPFPHQACRAPVCSCGHAVRAPSERIRSAGSPRSVASTVSRETRTQPKAVTGGEDLRDFVMDVAAWQRTLRLSALLVPTALYFSRAQLATIPALTTLPRLPVRS
jgi:hypothetical protein